MMKSFIVKIKNNIQLVTIVLIMFFSGVEQNKWTRIIEIIMTSVKPQSMMSPAGCKRVSI